MSKKILIIGGVAGGASAAARARRVDESAEIIMFERGATRIIFKLRTSISFKWNH